MIYFDNYTTSSVDRFTNTMIVCSVCDSYFVSADENGLPCGCVSEENAVYLISYDEPNIVIEWITQGLIDPYKICDDLNGWCVYTEAWAWDLDDVCNACLSVAPAPAFIFPLSKDIAPILVQFVHNSVSEPLALENNQSTYDSEFDSESDSDSDFW